MTTSPWDEDNTALTYWRLAEELSIREIALLLLGLNPEDFEGPGRKQREPKGYIALTTGLIAAVTRQTVEARPTYHLRDSAPNGGGFTELEDDPTNMNIYDTKIEVDSLINWLKSRGQTKGFFFGGGGSLEPYLDSENERYSPKLAAAVKAWLAVGETPTARPPKQQIIKWLSENAVHFGLTDEEGKPIDSAIESIATIANWAPKGGAPKTKPEPPPALPKPSPAKPKAAVQKRSFAEDLDTDTPF